MKKRVRMDDLQVFVTTVEAGGLSAAARQLDISPALASAALQRLEHSLGIRLLVRSTRRLRLSDDGERYLPHARQALDALVDGEMALEQARAELAGPLRLSMPSDLGRNLLLPWLTEFQAEYPRLDMRLRVSDQVADLFGEQLDASIRYGLLGIPAWWPCRWPPITAARCARHRPTSLGMARRRLRRRWPGTTACVM